MSLAQLPTPCCILVAAVEDSDFLAKMHVVMVPSPLKLSPYGPCQRQCYNQEVAGATSGKRLKIIFDVFKKTIGPRNSLILFRKTGTHVKQPTTAAFFNLRAPNPAGGGTSAIP
jgi:hypothetical protein